MRVANVELGEYGAIRIAVTDSAAPAKELYVIDSPSGLAEILLNLYLLVHAVDYVVVDDDYCTAEDFINPEE